jgi:hypothetical protein
MGRSYYVWVTGPEYYRERDGRDREMLEPGPQSGGWWSCAKSTAAGDLVCLYRTKPKQDIAYVLEALTPAFPSSELDLTRSVPWEYGCDFKVLCKLREPVTRKELLADKVLANSGPMRQGPRQRALRWSEHEWRRLMTLAVRKNPKLKTVLARATERAVPLEPQSERDWEDALAQNLKALKPLGYDLRLYVDDEGRVGRQYRIKGHGAIIDLLCVAKGIRKRLVVIELKRGAATPKDVGQVEGYQVAVKRALNRTPRGLVISQGATPAFDNLAQERGIARIDLSDLQL